MKLSKRQQEVLDFIRGFIDQNKMPPTYREIGQALGIASTNGVADHVKALIKKGYLSRSGSKGSSKARGIMLTEKSAIIDQKNIVDVPLLGHVAAGVPIQAAEEYLVLGFTEELTVDNFVVPQEEDYVDFGDGTNHSSYNNPNTGDGGSAWSSGWFDDMSLARTLQAMEFEIDEEMKPKKDDDVKEEKEEMDERKSRVKGEYGVGNEDGDKDDSKIEKETERMRFKEAMEEIQELKKELNEVNLLNAKLLYTNKLFRSRNVSEEQKMKVIEQFDRAANVREVKLVYTTFAESIARKPVNESAKRVSKASKPVASTESKKPIIGENTDFKARMKKLANII
mgnify:CR=1 FL=1